MVVVHGINKPLLDTIKLASTAIEINPVLKITGGLKKISGYAHTCLMFQKYV